MIGKMMLLICIQGLMRLKAANDWSTQKTFSDKIPQNIYPLSLNSGDNIEAIL